jgi:hypothetical protein
MWPRSRPASSTTRSPVSAVWFIAVSMSGQVAGR